MVPSDACPFDATCCLVRGGPRGAACWGMPPPLTIRRTDRITAEKASRGNVSCRASVAVIGWGTDPPVGGASPVPGESSRRDRSGDRGVQPAAHRLGGGSQRRPGSNRPLPGSGGFAAETGEQPAAHRLGEGSRAAGQRRRGAPPLRVMREVRPGSGRPGWGRRRVGRRGSRVRKPRGQRVAGGDPRPTPISRGYRPGRRRRSGRPRGRTS
jgi:hypothetical protein